MSVNAARSLRHGVQSRILVAAGCVSAVQVRLVRFTASSLTCTGAFGDVRGYFGICLVVFFLSKLGKSCLRTVADIGNQQAQQSHTAESY